MRFGAHLVFYKVYKNMPTLKSLFIGAATIVLVVSLVHIYVEF